jgi:hypothetical protein
MPSASKEVDTTGKDHRRRLNSGSLPLPTVDWGGAVQGASVLGELIRDRSGGVPAATNGNDYWAPAGTIFPRIKASCVLGERRFCPPLLQPCFQLLTQGMDGRVPASSYGSGNASSAPATIFPRTER